MPTDRLKELSALAEPDDDRVSALASLAEPEEQAPAAPKLAAPRRAPRTKAGASLKGVAPDLVEFAAEQDAVITSGTDSMSIRKPGSRHGSGDALDLRTRDKTPEQIRQMERAARERGYDVITKPHGTGPHMHISKRRGGQQPPAAPAQPDQLDADRVSELLGLAEQDSLPATPPTAGRSATPPVTNQSASTASPAAASPTGRKPGSRPTSTTSPDRWAEAPASAADASADALVETGVRDTTAAARGKLTPRARAVVESNLPDDLPERLPGVDIYNKRVTRGDGPDTYRVVDPKVEAEQKRRERQAATLRRRVARQRREHADLLAQAEAMNRARREDQSAPQLSVGALRERDNTAIEELHRKITSKGELLARDEERLRAVEAARSRAQTGGVGEIRALDAAREQNRQTGGLGEVRAMDEERARDRAYLDSIPEAARTPQMPGQADLNDPEQVRAARLENEAADAPPSPEELARRERVSRMGWGEYLAQAPKSAALGLEGVGTSALKGLGILSTGPLGALVPGAALVEQVRGNRAADESVHFKAGERIDEFARALVGTNPDLEQEFAAGKLPQAFGSMAGFVLGGWALAAPKTAAAVLGGLSGGSQVYDEVKQLGGSEAEAQTAALVGMGLLGPIEMAGGAPRIVERLNRGPQGHAWRALLRESFDAARREAPEEALQGGASEFVTGAVSGKHRSLIEVLEAAGLEGLAGAGASVAGSAANAVRARLGGAPVDENLTEVEGAFENAPAPAREDRRLAAYQKAKEEIAAALRRREEAISAYRTSPGDAEKVAAETAIAETGTALAGLHRAIADIVLDPSAVLPDDEGDLTANANPAGRAALAEKFPDIAAKYTQQPAATDPIETEGAGADARPAQPLVGESGAEPVAQNLASDEVENQATAPAEPETPRAQLQAVRAGESAVAVVPNGTKVPAPLRSFKDFDGNRVVYNPDLVEREQVVAAMDAGALDALNGGQRNGHAYTHGRGNPGGATEAAGGGFGEQAAAEEAAREEASAQPTAPLVEEVLSERAAGEGVGGGAVPERGTDVAGREAGATNGAQRVQPAPGVGHEQRADSYDPAAGVQPAAHGGVGLATEGDAARSLNETAEEPAHHSHYQPRDDAGAFTPGKPAIPARPEEAVSLAKTLRARLESAGTVESTEQAAAPEVGYSYRDAEGRVLEVRKADGREVVLGPRGGEGDATVSVSPERFAKEFEKTKHKFSSTQVDVPDSEAERLRDVGASLIPDGALYTDPADDSYGREDHPHITVKYGLHTEQADDVRRALEGTAPFEVTLGETSIFEAKGETPYDVVKVGVESPELRALNEKIAGALKVTDTHPDYVPHVTLAYVKRGEGKKYAGDKSFAGKKLSFDDVTFSSSNGETVSIPLEGEKLQGEEKPAPVKGAEKTAPRPDQDTPAKKSAPPAGEPLSGGEVLRGVAERAAAAEAEMNAVVGKRARVGKREGTIQRAYTSTEGVEALDILFDGKGEPTPVQRKNAQVIEEDAESPKGEQPVPKAVETKASEPKPLREGNVLAQVGEFGGWAMNDRFLFHEDVTVKELEAAREFVRDRVQNPETNAVHQRLSRIALDAINEKLKEMRAAEQPETPAAKAEKKAPAGRASELGNALNTIGAIKSRHLIENPNGTWSFAGAVPVELGYTTPDGGVPTDEQAKNIRQFGPRLAGVKSRVWQTKEAAEQASAEFDARQAGAEPKAAETRPPDLYAFYANMNALVPILVGNRLYPRDATKYKNKAAKLGVATGEGSLYAEAVRRLAEKRIGDKTGANYAARDVIAAIMAEANTTPSTDTVSTDTLTREEVSGKPSIAEQLSPEAQAALDRLKKKFQGKTDPNKLNSATPFGNDDLIDAAIVSAEVVRLGVRKTADWARQMVELVGDAVRPYLGRIWDATLVELDVAGHDTSDLPEEFDAKTLDAETGEAQDSFTDSEVDTDADAQLTDGDGQDRDGGTGAEDARGIDGERPSGRGGKGARPGGSRSSGRPRGEGAGRVGDEQPSAPGEGTRAGRSQPPRGGNRDSAGDGVPERRGNDYVAPVGGLTREGSWRETARRNLDILELVKRLEQEGRLATPEEQQLLAKFTGWGATEIANNIFPGVVRYGEIRPELARDGWEDLARRAKEIFTPEELKTASRSTQYAHYTSEKVVRAIWSGLTQLGFKQGKIFEPGMGVGHFFTAAPVDVSTRSRYTGIEMDAMTARVAKQLLQNQAVLEADFVKQKFPDNFFDVAIGNPPFAKTVIEEDRRYRKYRFPLHDFFFAKTIDKVRPGGLLVFVTSRYTMDKAETKTRDYIAERADLLGAIRLPQTAFKQNAGTEVVTDVLFLRKRMEGEEPAGEAWTGLADVAGKNDKGQTVEGLVNEYFVAHPGMVLGTHAFTGSMYRENEYTVTPAEGDIEEHFLTAVRALPSAVFAEQGKTEEKVKAARERDWNPASKKEGSVYVHADGTLMRVESGSGVALRDVMHLPGAHERWLKDYVSLRTALKRAQLDQLKDGDWEKSLKELNRTYDAFVKKHGHVLEFTTYEKEKTDPDGNVTVELRRRYKNNRLLLQDIESPLVVALEQINEDGKIVKGSMLLRRTIKRPEPPVIRTLSDALAVSLDQVGALNLDHVAELITGAGTPMTRADVILELGDAIFEVPGGDWQMRDEYLSGFVVQKLEEAEAAAAADPRFERNVRALAEAQPKPLLPAQIQVNLGAPWVPAEVVTEFAERVLGIQGPVTYNHDANLWSVQGAFGQGSQSNRSASNDWGTQRRSPQELFESALANQSVKIYDTVIEDRREKKVLNQSETVAANDKIKKMRDAFKGWIWTDGARAQTLAERYNRLFNNIVPRGFDGSHLSLPGLSHIFKLHAHQKRAVWRILQSGNTYLAHAVGAGKTLEMIVSAMEQKRLGLINKPLFIVPGHMLKQFSSEFLEAYPMANILVADEESFKKENRRRFVAQAALNDLDAIVMTHTSFGKIQSKEESIAPIRDALIEQLRDAIAALDPDDRTQQRFIKRLENRIEKIERRFGARTSGEGKDDVVTFEEMGVDFLYVDEAHEFRKLDFVTDHTYVKGINPEGSQMAMDLHIKTTWLNQQRPGRALVLASGTPITNTIGELYTVMRYMDPQELEDSGIEHFDAWAASFGEVVADYEMNAAGQYELVERFSKFVNMPELMKRVRKFMDVLTLKQLSGLVDLPFIETGTPDIVVVPETPEQKAFREGTLKRRIEASRAWKPTFQQPNNPDPLIAIIADARLAAVDMRFITGGSAASEPTGSKLDVMIDGIIKEYHDYKDLEYHNKTTGAPDPTKGAAQIVFAVQGFGDGVMGRRGFDAKRYLLNRLAKAGIPASEVAFMGDYKAADAKENMFKEMRQGTKRILIGSPANMGTGVNVQKRLRKSHFLMPPWYPSDVEQPDGRIMRQGNQNKDRGIGITRYATKGSYDSTGWAMNARKARAIEQAMTGDDSARTVEDISESSLYDQASAMAAGDERAIKLAGLRRDVEKLKSLREAHINEQYQLRADAGQLERRIAGSAERLETFRQADAAVGGYVAATEFETTVGGVTYEKRAEMGDALKEAWLREAAESRRLRDEYRAKRRVQLQESLKKAETEADKKFLKKMLAGVDDLWGDNREAEIGSTKGFPLVVSLDGAARGSLYLRIKGVSLGVTDEYRSYAPEHVADEIDSQGLGTRVFNALNSLPKIIGEIEEGIRNARRELAQAESKIGRPFAEEQELFEKVAELDQLQREMAGDGIKIPEVEARPGGDIAGPRSFIPDAEEAAQLKRKIMRQLKSLLSGNALASGFYPAHVVAEIMPDLARLGAYHIKQGATTLKAFSGRMVDDLGEGITPHLRNIYKEAKKLIEGEHEREISTDAAAHPRPVDDVAGTAGPVVNEDGPTEQFAREADTTNPAGREDVSDGRGRAADADLDAEDNRGDGGDRADRKERSFPKTLETAGLEGGDDRTYEVYTNRQALEDADAVIAEKGVDGAAEHLLNAEDWGAEHTALAYRLLAQTDGQRAVDVAAAAARALTRQGQAVQAAQIVSRLAPERVAVVAARVAEEAGVTLSPEKLEELKTLASAAQESDARARDLEARLASAEREAADTGARVSRLEEELARVRRQLHRGLEAEERADDLERKVSNLQAQIRRLKEEKPGKQRKLRTTAVGVRATALTRRLDKLEQEARARLAARKGAAANFTVKGRDTSRRDGGSEAGASAVPLDLADWAIIGAAKIARGTLDFAAWSAEMAADLDDEVRPYLKAVYLRSLQTLREEREALRLDRLKRAAVRSQITEETTQEEIDALLDDAEQMARLMAEAEDARREAQRRAQELGQAFEELDPKSPARRAGVFALEAVGAFRDLMASGDLPPVLRQGLVLSLNHPPAAARSFARGVVAGFSRSRYENIYEEIKRHPRFRQARASGLFLAYVEDERHGARETLRSLTRREEMFRSRLTSWLPWVKFSSRNFTAFMDLMRLHAFTAFAEHVEAMGLPAAEAKRAVSDGAAFVNVASGRGTLGKKLDAAMAPLSAAFFSPRYLFSRVQLAFYPLTLSPVARRHAYYQLFKAAGLLGALMALLAAFVPDLELEWDDPEDGDWLKLRAGDSRWDVLGGFQQPFRALYRVAKSTARQEQGERVERGDAPLEILGSFLRRKLSPQASLVVDRLVGTTLEYDEQTGKPKPFTWGEAVTSRLAPISARDVVVAARREGAAGAAKASPSMVGAGYANYRRAERAKLSPAAQAAFDQVGKLPYKGPQRLKIAGRDRELTAEERGRVEAEVSVETSRRVGALFAPADEAGRRRLDRYETADAEGRRKILDDIQNDASEAVRSKFAREWQKAHKSDVERERAEKRTSARSRREEMDKRKEGRAALLTPEESRRAVERLGRNANRP